MSIFEAIIILVSILIEFSSCKSFLRLKRQSNDCKDTVTLQDCVTRKDEVDETIHLLRIKTNQIVAHYKTECDFDKIKYHWLLRSGHKDIVNAETNTNVYILEPFSLKTDEYAVQVTVTIIRKGIKSEIATGCLVSIDALDPIPIIEGGTERTVEAGYGFVMNASRSIDRDVPVKSPPKLTFKWQCQILEGTDQNFCKKEYEGSTLKVPASTNQKYFFILSIKSQDSKSWISTNQTIKLLSQVAELDIICEKNCFPITVSKRLTFLRVICAKNCEGIEESSYEWTVDGNFDYQNTQYGRNSDKFIIKEGVLQPGIVKIRVDLKRGGSASEILKVQDPIKIESCRAEPNQGTAIKTNFKIDCKYTGEGYSFEVYTKKNSKTVLLNKNYKLEGLEFVLPSSTEVYIRILDADDFYDEYKLGIQVTSGDTSDAEISSLSDSIPNLIKTGDTDLAVQIANALIEELDKKDSSKAKETKLTLLESFHDIRIKSQSKARQISQLVTRLVHNPSAPSDPYQGELASDLCKRSAVLDLQELQNEYSPKSLTSETLDVTKTLLQCVETDAKPNAPLLVPTPLPLDLTTPYPLLTIPVITENYPDYDNDDSVSEKTKKYKAISRNFLEICSTNLRMLALTVVEGEKTVENSADASSVQVTRLVGDKLAGKEIGINSGIFQMSRDVRTFQGAVDLQVCCWDNDIFWWSKWQILTKVYLIRVYSGNDRIQNFEKPNLLVLDLQKEQALNVLSVAKNEPLAVIRVEVMAKEAFFVDFHGTTSMHVLITVFEKPEEEQVRKSGQVVTGNSQLYFDYDKDYDAWCYISVVPSSGTMDFGISVYSASCYSWKPVKHHWQFACKGTSNSTKTKIFCLCNRMSILAGIIHNNIIKIDDITTHPDFEMTLISSYVIFVSTALVFLLYCIFFTLVVRKKQPKKKPLYLPGDISSYHRYVYLISVHTGRRPSSGTSSNICIQIFGQKSNSATHILNYPDPYKRIFQWGNHDWFVLPTQSCLGKLTDVALWTDFTGRTPRWYCTNIKIFDLQTSEKWYFKLNTWFGLPPENHIYVKVAASDEKKVRGLGMKFRFFPRRMHQADFDQVTKLTFLLSIVLMIFWTTLVCYGMPFLTLNDGFGWYCDFEFQSEIIWIGLGTSLVTFLLHMTWVWFFRNSGEGKKYPKRGITTCWIILISHVALSFTVLVFFGFWKPLVMAWFWFTSVIISIFVYFLILENVYETVTNRFGRVEEDLNLLETFKKHLREIENQRKVLFKTFGENLLRPYLKHLYTPLEEEDIKIRKAHVLARSLLVTLLKDTGMFISYVFLLYISIFALKNPLTIYNHVEMIDLLSGEHTRTESYSDINTIPEFYNYVNETLIPTLHAQHWYGKYVVQEPGMMADFNNKFLGVARLRQQRIKLHSCKDIFDFMKNQSCHGEYKDSWSNSSNFMPNYNEFARLAPIWNYTKMYKGGGVSITIGKFGIYFGGGFIAPLGRTLYNSYANLYYLLRNNWLDEPTSVIMIEFLTYNVNSNLFNAVRILSERSASGYIRNTIDHTTSEFLYVKDRLLVAQILIYGSFCWVVFIFTCKIITRIFLKKWYIYKELWTLVDLLIIILTYTCFALYFARTDEVKKFLDKVEKSKKNEFINYYTLLIEDKSLTIIAAILIFVSTIRLWKMCRVGTFFRIFEITVLKCASSFFIIMLDHRIVLVAFSLCGNMIFGAHSFHFREFLGSIITLMIISLGFEGHIFDDLFEVNPVFGRFYYAFYMMLNLLFSTIYIALIIDSYYKAQVVVASDLEFTTFKSFLSKEYHFYRTYMKINLERLKSGGKSGGAWKKRQVTPKPEEFRYKNCITIPENTLELMSCIAIYALKKYSLTQHQKEKLMQKVVRSFGMVDKTGIFFTERNLKGTVRVIPDRKMVQIEHVVEGILDPDHQIKKEKREKYKKMFAMQINQLNYFRNVLTTVLRLVSNIEVE